MSEIEPTRIDLDAPQLAEASSVNELCGLIRNVDSALVVGNRTKAPLSSVDKETLLISTRKLSGITQYEPSEFTFTAQSGTTLREINAVLHEQDQYLPFDPMLVDQGATLGGTLAAGLSGPGRHRFGGVRDFVLGVEFVAGDGELITAGGKVVKNAAGFDIPKLLVGSCGRFGAITALTFKVFPRPTKLHSYRIRCTDHQEASRLIAELARGRWELDAIDYDGELRAIWFRIGGEDSVCELIAADIARTINLQEVVAQSPEEADPFWTSIGALEFGGAKRETIVKVPMDLDCMPELAQWCDNQRDSTRFHSSVGGAIGWLAVNDGLVNDAGAFLKKLGRTGLVVRGQPNRSRRCIVGNRNDAPIEAAIKSAMDPPGRFPGFAE